MLKLASELRSFMQDGTIGDIGDRALGATVLSYWLRVLENAPPPPDKDGRIPNLGLISTLAKLGGGAPTHIDIGAFSVGGRIHGPWHISARHQDTPDSETTPLAKAIAVRPARAEEPTSMWSKTRTAAANIKWSLGAAREIEASEQAMSVDMASLGAALRPVMEEVEARTGSKLEALYLGVTVSEMLMYAVKRGAGNIEMDCTNLMDGDKNLGSWVITAFLPGHEETSTVDAAGQDFETATMSGQPSQAEARRFLRQQAKLANVHKESKTYDSNGRLESYSISGPVAEEPGSPAPH